MGCNERQENGIVGLSFFAKHSELTLQLSRVFFVDFERVHRELHLADVCAVVGSIDEHVDLSAVGSRRFGLMDPRGFLGLDTCNPECFLDLCDVLQTKRFKCITAPSRVVATRGFAKPNIGA